MAWRYHGRASVNPRSPSAFGACDRCGFVYNLDDLNNQFDWRGPRLANLHVKVCRPCMDKPFNFFRPVILPPDPVPRRDPRPEPFDAEMGTEPTPWSPAFGAQVTELAEDDLSGVIGADDGIEVLIP